MTRFAVQRCIGNSIEVLGMYESKKEMLLALDQLRIQYAGQAGVINGISGELNEDGLNPPGNKCRLY